MPNLSQLKRKRMLEFLGKIKEEHKNDDEMLIALGEIENELNSKKYGLVWEEHEEKVDVQMRTHIPVFTEVKEREISALPDKPYNFLLEGDNLHSLYLLEKTHKGAIDLIYIDPPYNTGNEDFIYDDTLIDTVDGFRHSKWLSFMGERLRIAERLLSSEGCILISIDDNEQAPLKLLCDDIFGAEKFVAQLVWEKKKKGSFLSNQITNIKEYIIVYCKDKEKFNGLIGEINSNIETYPCINAINKRSTCRISKGIKSNYKEKNLVIPAGTIISDSTMNIKYVSDLIIKDGKTIILIDFIEEYLSKVDGNTAFVWLCPGKGDLEEQSRKKMIKYNAQRNTQNLFDALQNGFPAESTTFINWELVTKSGNTALRDGERKNLFDRIVEAHRANITFIVIIDEEHSNNTAKAKAIIDAFSAKNIIRVSATAVENKRFEYFEIDEMDVINAGLITKALYVNEGITDGMEVKDDYDFLLELADNKRKAIAERYRQLNKTIRPMTLIQFPSGQPETILAVEKKLESMGYTYENGMVSKWMSGDKRDLPDNLTENDGIPVFLLMKQAISTGWDCPRAKILVKLREGMSESFEIQTIGRIRRMPEARHYEDDLLDFCYVYTFDEKYKAGLLSSVDKAYETRRLFLKQKCKVFTLEKQLRNLDFGGLGEREVYEKIYEHLNAKYHLGRDKKQNERLLAEAGYIFGDKINGQLLSGEFVRTSSLIESDEYKKIHKTVDTHKHGILLMHSVDMIKSAINVQTPKVKTILERLFRKKLITAKNIVVLDTKEFYAFVINNARRLRQDFKEVTAQMAEQMEFVFKPKTMPFVIPEQDFYKYDPTVKNEAEYLSNAYEEYTSGFATSVVRSTSEMLFEQYCEKREDIDWVYKNGDSGQQYFSIVYIDGMRHQWLFYADYIVKKKDGTIWVIETKGGESKGKDKNIDIQIENKFNAFKLYAAEHNLHWGFVRDKDFSLYIDNTEFSEDMADEHWVPLGQIF